ncbi:MAG: prolyl oligopeptidase family serine peptidase [Bacteroidota bacterium]
MPRYFTFVLLLLFLTPSLFLKAQNILIKGLVIDQQTKEPLPFVHIQLHEIALGTVTEANGRFQIVIPSKHLNRTLHFSYLGYEDYEISVKELSKKKEVSISMKVAAEMLSEVVIRPKKLPSARSILRKVIRNIPENYGTTNILIDGYYRETIKENGVYMKFTDAACSYHSAPYPTKKLNYKDYASPFGNISASMSYFSDFAGAALHRVHFHHSTLKGDQVKIIDSRASLNRTTRDMNANITGGPLSLFARNRVKYQQSFLGRKKHRDFDYIVDEEQDENGQWQYVLLFKTKTTPATLDALENPKNNKQWTKANKHKLLEGKIYIDPEDFAVLRYECWVPNELKKYFCGYTVMAIKHFDYKLDVRFKKTEEKYRIDFLRHEDEFIFKDTTDNTVTPYAAISEFYVHDIQQEHIQALKPVENFANQNNNQLYDYPLEYDSTFWQQYEDQYAIAKIDESIRADMESEKTLEEQFRDKHLKDENLQAPVADKKPITTKIHGRTLVDDYHWLKQAKGAKGNKTIMNHLIAENAYTDNYFIPLRKLQREIAEALKLSMEKDFTSLPTKDNGYYYYFEYKDEQEYPVYFRKPIDKPTEEEILLDVNQLKEDNPFYSVGGLQVSPDNNIMAFAENTTGSDRYVIKFKNLETGELLKDSLLNVGGLVWIDPEHFIYAAQEPKSLRTSKIMRHNLGTPQTADELVFEETDPLFQVACYRSKSKAFVFISSGSTNTSELHYLRTDRPNDTFRVFLPREEGHGYGLIHHKDQFYIISDKDAINNQIWQTDTSRIDPKYWTKIIDHRPNVLIEGLEVFDNYLVLDEKENAQNQLRIIDQSTQKSHYIKFKEDLYSVGIGYNPDTDTDTLNLSYSSFLTPSRTINYHMGTQKRRIVKSSQKSVYNFAKYKVERTWATAPDGTLVPISLFYNKWRVDKKSGKHGRLYLTSYGSYGSGSSVGYNQFAHVLLDRGFVYAIAHVRGGNDLGMQWYHDGRMLKKKNTFTDFIACAEHLIAEGYARAGSITAQGGSAGGLLMGAVANMRPDLFKTIILDVPFVDVINTMLDDQLPLTTGEYLEWGNPNKKKYFNYMLSYSPYENVKAQDYPNMLFFTGLNDTRVGYWEPAKMAAKLRATKTDDNLLLLKTDLNAGHGGGSGRYAWVQDASYKLALIFSLY